ncbi:hypothetical protein VB779_12500 [Haloarculaceae archaeon H-GB11]|nr:hypothetical protein [Haloarculaceae archaeon H-GB11]
MQRQPRSSRRPRSLPAFVQRADEVGLLVWQGLPLVGSGSFDTERGSSLAARIDDQYRHAPSSIAFSVHENPLDLFPDRLGSGLLDRLRLRWRVWRSEYDHGPAREVASALPDDAVTLPVVGPPGTDPDAATIAPGWDYGEPKDVSWLLDTYPSLSTVVGGFGVGSVGVADPEELVGFDREKHAAHASLSDRAESQAYQARALSTIAETLRQRDCGVVVATALRDLADAGLGVYARDGSPKAAADALATAFEPVQAFLADPAGSESDVVVHNDTPDPISGTLSWSSDETDGETEVSVDPCDQAVATTVSLPSTGRIELTVDHPRGTSTNTYRM